MVLMFHAFFKNLIVVQNLLTLFEELVLLKIKIREWMIFGFEISTI